MEISIKLAALEEKKGEDGLWRDSIGCEIEQDIEDDKLMILTFGYNKPFFLNKQELLKAIDILNK